MDPKHEIKSLRKLINNLAKKEHTTDSIVQLRHIRIQLEALVDLGLPALVKREVPSTREDFDPIKALLSMKRHAVCYLDVGSEHNYKQFTVYAECGSHSSAEERIYMTLKNVIVTTDREYEGQWILAKEDIPKIVIVVKEALRHHTSHIQIIVHKDFCSWSCNDVQINTGNSRYTGTLVDEHKTRYDTFLDRHYRNEDGQDLPRIEARAFTGLLPYLPQEYHKEHLQKVQVMNNELVATDGHRVGVVRPHDLPHDLPRLSVPVAALKMLKDAKASHVRLKSVTKKQLDVAELVVAVRSPKTEASLLYVNLGTDITYPDYRAVIRGNTNPNGKKAEKMGRFTTRSQIKAFVKTAKNLNFTNRDTVVAWGHGDQGFSFYPSIRNVDQYQLEDSGQVNAQYWEDALMLCLEYRQPTVTISDSWSGIVFETCSEFGTVKTLVMPIGKQKETT